MEKNISKRRTDIAAETIGKQIVRGKLSIGQVLPNDQVMCETLGISRTILREALRILGAKGLVKAIPKAGTFVNDTDKWAMLDIDILNWLTDTTMSGRLEPLLVEMIDIRLAIEPGAAALTASRAQAAERQRISELFQSLKLANTPASSHEAEAAFIDCILANCHNRFFNSHRILAKTCLKLLFDHTERYNYLSLTAHEAAVRAIINYEPQNARRSMQAILLQASPIIRNKKNPADVSAG
jgi:GntR family galactonate operon transcriptional repressor